MKTCPFVFLLYPILFLCLSVTRPLWASWQGDPPLKMQYLEHEFLAACREGNIPAVKFYLADENFDPNRCFRSGNSGNMITGLFVAAYNGHDKVVQILADTEGVDPNRAWNGATPVFVASQNGHDKVVQILADTEGVDLNRAWKGAAPVFVASQKGHDKVVQILARTEGVDLNQAWNGATPLFMASQNGHDRVVQILARTEGVDLNQAWNGVTPVFMASQNGHGKVVQLLVDAGAGPAFEVKAGRDLFSKTARTIAIRSRTSKKRRNPENHDTCCSTIHSLTQAERHRKKKHATPVTPIDDSGYSHSAVSEKTPLMAKLRRLSVTGKYY